MVSFTDHYNAIAIDRLPSKSKIGKDSWYFNNCLLCKAKFSSATKTFPFLLKTQKNNYFSENDWWEYTKSCFKDNGKIFSKNSSTQENITNSRQKSLFLLTKNTNTKSSFKDNARTFSPLKKIFKTLWLKEGCKTYTRKKTSNKKSNQRLKTYRMNFII